MVGPVVVTVPACVVRAGSGESVVVVGEVTSGDVPTHPAAAMKARTPIRRAKIRLSIFFILPQQEINAPVWPRGKKTKKAILSGVPETPVRSLLYGLFLRLRIMMDKPALIDTLPVLRHELPVRSRFHDRVALLPADEAFHKSRLLIDNLHDMFVLCHPPAL